MTGPLWTTARLQRVMMLRFGFNRRGGVNTQAAAAEMGVSARTVQRWLHGAPRSLAHIPPARREQLLAMLVPSTWTLRREQQTADQAVGAIEQVRAHDPLVSQEWTAQRWLEPHRVVILDTPIRHLHIRQVAFCLDEPRRVAALHRRGRVVQQVTVPSRFHATVIVHRILDQVGPWRYTATRSQVKRGYTWTWLADRTTPTVSLAAAGADLGPLPALDS